MISADVLERIKSDRIPDDEMALIKRVRQFLGDPLFIVVDLFCGAGGTTTGFDQAELKLEEERLHVGPDFKTAGFTKIVKVIACVNHDAKAILSHWRNHPEVKHFEEDIRTLNLSELIALVAYYRQKYPFAKLILWASLECTNFSKAKGGQPRDADSRTLADHLERYILALDPDYVQIENVVEFMSWGPLDEKGKPVSRKNGSDWMRWRKEICAMGYYDDWKELNSANFGAYTSRNRLFGVFAKHGLPIAWPAPTHAKVPSKASMYGDLKKWMAVKEVLNFQDEGESIFNRKKPLSDKTLERIYAGLLKYVAKGDTSFISKYFSGRPKGKVNSVEDPSSTVTTFGNSSLVQAKSFSDLSIDEPAGTITTIDHHALVNTSFITQRNTGEPESKLVDINGPARTLTATGGNQDLIQPEFLLKYNSTDKKGVHYPPSVNDPCPVVTAQNRLGLIQPKFLMQYYSQGGQHSSIESPSPTIPTRDRIAIVNAEFLAIYNGKSQTRSVNEPGPTIATNDRFGLVQPEFFMVDPQWGSTRNGSAVKSLEVPCQTLLAAGSPPSIVQVDPFIMPTNFNNTPKSIEDPAPTITADRHHTYIVNPSHGGHSTSTDAPCPVIIARQDKAPLYLVQAEGGAVAIAIFDCDTEIMIKIKQFMSAYGLVDIKMRMLRVLELLKIQGFPADYQLEGNQTDQKKFIGNSVVPHVVKAWAEAMGTRLLDHQFEKVA